MRALTGLKQAGMAFQKSDQNGRPAEMPLNKIHADPNNSRRPEDENSAEGLEEQAELTRDIKKRGVKSPISLRPHPTIADEFIVNFGHRRLVGAIEAGLATIPYFLDVTFDSYDQVKENLLHRRPSVWALAQFVQRKLDEQQSKSEIAEGLGKSNQNLVTELLALVDAPSCLHQAYESGVKSTRTLYDLRRAYDEFPGEVETWCAVSPKITRTTVQDLVTKLRQGLISTPLASSMSEPVGTSDQSAISREGTANMATSAEERNPTASGSVVKSELRHDVITPRPETLQSAADDLCEAEKQLPLSVPSKLPAASPECPQTAREILVEYKGKTARIAPDAIVKIVVGDDNNIPVDVLVSDLLFKIAE
jgi:ParB family chromosome partitioning protein